MKMINEERKLIERCVSLANESGREKKAFVTGRLSNARVLRLEAHDNNAVEILVDQDSNAVEIVIYGEDFTSAGDGGNPAVYITRDGELIRWHGEMYNARSFIEQVLSNMRVT